MKRCPQCRRDYFDDTLSFCLEDGSALIHGLGSIHSTEAPPSSFDPPTMMIHSTAAPDSVSSTGFPPYSPYHAQTENAIAVLPFANISRDEDAEYLSDGLAEELLNVLSRINGLRVAGRTSSFSFKGKQTTFAEIGRQLNVSSVLEGSVRTAGKRVRISVQLVNISDGYHLWSQTYDRTMDDIFAIQDDIAASVVEEVRTRLLDKEVDPSLSRQVKVEIADAVRGRVENPEAHRLMLLGRHFVFRGNNDDLKQAIGHFERALAIDPLNAECWVKLGIAHVHRASQAPVGHEDGYEEARRCANQALSINNDFAAGYALLARIRLEFDLDFGGCDESIKKAIELDPNGVDVLLAAGLVMRFLSRLDESAEMYRRLIETDPLNVSGYRGLTNTLLYAGAFDDAEVAIRRAVELWPESTFVQAQIGLILLGQGRTEEARDAALKEPLGPWRGWALTIIEVAAGRQDEAKRVLDEYIVEFSVSGSFQIAEVYACMGSNDEAFRYLKQAFETRDPGTSAILASPLLKPLHSDARWQPLLRKIGVPEEYWPKP